MKYLKLLRLNNLTYEKHITATVGCYEQSVDYYELKNDIILSANEEWQIFLLKLLRGI